MPAILFAIFIDLLGFGIIVPILPFLVEGYGALTIGPFTLGEAAVGTALFSIYSIFAFLAGPLWGRLSDRIGRRPALAATFLGATSAYIVLAFSDSLLMLFLARSLSGAMAGNVGIAMAAMADLTDEQNRGRAMGLIGAVFGLGFAFGPFIGGILGTSNGQASVFVPGLAAAGLSFLAMILALKFMPETSQHQSEEDGQQPRAKSRWADFLNTPEQAALFAMFIITAVGQSISFSVMPFWTKAILNWSQQEVGFLLGGIGLCIAAIQSMATGPLFKKIGELRALLLGAAVHLVGCCLLVMAPATVMTAVISFPLIMSGLTISFPALNSLLSRRTDRHNQGAALGLSAGMSALGRVVGPVAGGMMFERLNPDAPFIGVAVTGAIALFWSLWELRKTADA